MHRGGWVRYGAWAAGCLVTASAYLQEEQHHRGCGRKHDQLGPITDLRGAGKLALRRGRQSPVWARRDRVLKICRLEKMSLFLVG